MTAFFLRLKEFFQGSNSTSANQVFLEKLFQIRIKDFGHFDLALTHRSHTSEGDNERLELLGDAVLDLVVADYIFRSFPDMDEGMMTKLKSKFISRENLKLIANREGLIEGLDLSKQRDLSQKLIIGNVLEAIFGAIYIDQGYQVAKVRAIRMFERASPVEELLGDLHDPKSQVLEWAQKQKKEIRFAIDTKGRDRFEARLYLDQELVATGIGKSKKKSEKDASRIAIESLQIGDEDSA